MSRKPRPAEPDLPIMRRRLLAWYRQSHRDLPWRRRESDGYAQWLAEVMLQQTQVATVVPYFERFIRRFPTVRRLARADLDEVLQLWTGLGYYRRAVYLHAAAQRVVSDFRGEFPPTVKELLTLPGVGRYTAGAIASIAFGARVPVLDGNVKRVLARLYGLGGELESPKRIRLLWRLAEDALPKRGCGHFNQALMELGATVCVPRSPDCGACPVATMCRAQLAGAVDRIPGGRPKPATAKLQLIAMVITCGRRVLLRKRPDRGLWAGMWDFPGVEWQSSCPPSSAYVAACGSEILPPSIRPRIGRFHPLPAVRFRLTHREVVLHGFRTASNYARVPASHRWADASRSAGMPTAFQKVLQLLEWPQASDGKVVAAL